MVGRDTFPSLAPALGSKQIWLCHRLPLFMAVSMILNMRHSSRYCKRHSWRRKFGVFISNQLERLPYNCSTRHYSFIVIPVTRYLVTGNWLALLLNLVAVLTSSVLLLSASSLCRYFACLQLLELLPPEASVRSTVSDILKSTI